MKESIGKEIPAALVEALQGMSKEEILNLVLKLAQEQSDFQRTLLANVIIAPQIINKQPRDPHLVKRFKKDISDFFNEIQRRSEYDDDDYNSDDDDDDYPELDTVFEKAQTLNSADQIEVFWHVVNCGNTMFEEYSVGSMYIEKAIKLYGEVVAKLGIEHEKKLPYFDSLLKACGWDICARDNIRNAIKYALDKISTSTKDYQYLVTELEKHQRPEWSEWLADYFIKLGDDKNYLRIRYQHLESEAQYLDLANYWNRKGNSEKYLKTMEQWVSTLSEKSRQSELDLNYDYSFNALPRSESILTILADYYQSKADERNFCRILMTKAQYDNFTLELYQQIEEVSKKLKKWKEHQPLLIEYAQDRDEVLARIYLYEKNWQAAIKLTKKLVYNEKVKVLIAQGIMENQPQEAIGIYQQLVQNHIHSKSRKSRDHYRIAAQYAAEIKSIYLSIIKDKASWQQYIDLIRKTYNRFPALKDEFHNL